MIRNDDVTDTLSLDFQECLVYTLSQCIKIIRPGIEQEERFLVFDVAVFVFKVTLLFPPYIF